MIQITENQKAEAMSAVNDFTAEELSLLIYGDKPQQVRQMPQGKPYHVLIKAGGGADGREQHLADLAHYYLLSSPLVRPVVAQFEGNTDALKAIGLILQSCALQDFYFVRWQKVAAVYDKNKQEICIAETVCLGAALKKLVAHV